MIQAAVNPATYPGLHLLFIGTEACEPGKGWGPGVKEHYKIHYIHRGRGRFVAEGQAYSLGSGHAFLIEPGQVVQYEADKLEPWSYSWIIFDGDQAAASLERAGLGKANPVVLDGPGAELGLAMEELLMADQGGRSTDIRQQSIFLAFMAALIDRGDERIGPGQNRQSMQEMYVRSALLYLQVHFSASLSIEDLARHVGIDRKYLSALFKRHVHQSPQEYLSHFRMERARVLLGRQELSIAQVARSVGYKDPLAFSKAFRLLVGISPRDYRRALA